MVLTGLFPTVAPYKDTEPNAKVILWLTEKVQALTGECERAKQQQETKEKQALLCILKGLTGK